MSELDEVLRAADGPRTWGEWKAYCATHGIIVRVDRSGKADEVVLRPFEARALLSVCSLMVTRNERRR